MRMFGGQQMENLLSRFNIDENMPIEMNMVNKLVEQAQTRVEGANFDVRKHLLEYDDVLNTQRNRIYEERNKIFTKEYLHEDVNEMLQIELQTASRAALPTLKDPGSCWHIWKRSSRVSIQNMAFIPPSLSRW